VNTNCLHSIHHKSALYASIFLLSVFRLFKICLKIGCIPLFFFSKNNSGSYHVGGTLPMSAKVGNSLETDELGRVNAWQHVHIIDSTIFPSLPGTTIGLLAMANAMRIVEKIRWS
jgi:choline dehydrogenase-like flavoprotein